MSKIMTKEEYIAWINTRGDDAGKWSLEKCYAADVLIKKTATDNFDRWADNHVPIEVRDFLKSILYIHFGSTEVDALLTTLKCYPEWM